MRAGPLELSLQSVRVRCALGMPLSRYFAGRELVAITFLEIRFLRVWSAWEADVYVVSEDRHRSGKITICVRCYSLFESRPQRFTLSCQYGLTTKFRE